MNITNLKEASVHHNRALNLPSKCPVHIVEKAFFEKKKKKTNLSHVHYMYNTNRAAS